MPVVAVSGGFDPLHAGHINLIEGAAQYGDVLVILNSDEWLRRKKGYVFMPWDQRARVLAYLKPVIDVVPVDDRDGTVLDALKAHRPEYFANGGDRVGGNTPELVYCLDYGITPLFDVGGYKVASSQELVRAAGDGVFGR